MSNSMWLLLCVRLYSLWWATTKWLRNPQACQKPHIHGDRNDSAIVPWETLMTKVMKHRFTQLVTIKISAQRGHSGTRSMGFWLASRSLELQRATTSTAFALSAKQGLLVYCWKNDALIHFRNPQPFILELLQATTLARSQSIRFSQLMEFLVSHLAVFFYLVL